ncbi:MAG: mobilization protein C, partial [Deltaproteobacteria bacterium]|nr:mobilization protein C [Deltaproteobacteria bacterium]
MARKTEAERLAELQARKRALEAQMQAISARQKQRSRKDDTRRKVLVGAAGLAEADKNAAAKQKLMALLDQPLTRDLYRAVFD